MPSINSITCNEITGVEDPLLHSFIFLSLDGKAFGSSYQDYASFTRAFERLH